MLLNKPPSDNSIFFKLKKLKIYYSSLLEAAPGGYSDIPQKHSSRNSPKIHKINGSKNCEAAIKSEVRC